MRAPQSGRGSGKLVRAEQEDSSGVTDITALRQFSFYSILNKPDVGLGFVFFLFIGLFEESAEIWTANI